MANVCSNKKFQSNRASSSRDMAKCVGKSHKKKEKEKVIKITNNSRKNSHHYKTPAKILFGYTFWSYRGPQT